MTISNNIINPIERKKEYYQEWLAEDMSFFKLMIQGLCNDEEKEFCRAVDALQDLIEQSLDEEIDQLYFARPTRRDFNNWVAWKAKENGGVFAGINIEGNPE